MFYKNTIQLGPVCKRFFLIFDDNDFINPENVKNINKVGKYDKIGGKVI